MNRTDDRAVVALLNAIVDWAAGNPLDDGLGFCPAAVAGLQRRFGERMAALGRGDQGGGDSSEIASTEANRPPSRI